MAGCALVASCLPFGASCGIQLPQAYAFHRQRHIGSFWADLAPGCDGAAMLREQTVDPRGCRQVHLFGKVPWWLDDVDDVLALHHGTGSLRQES